MGLRQMFFFIVLLALAFTVGTYIGSLRGISRVPTLPSDAINVAMETEFGRHLKEGDKRPASSSHAPALGVKVEAAHDVKSDGLKDRLMPILNRKKTSSETREKHQKETFHKKVVTTPPQQETQTVHHSRKAKSKFSEKNFTLPEIDPETYIKTYSRDVKCLMEGTNLTKSEQKSECVCLKGWHGLSCSMPEVVFKSNYPFEHGIILRNAPTRIIYAMPFSHELDLLEAKMDELYDVVDVFLILESNWSAVGKPKDRLLLNRLNTGFLSEYQDKIVYVSLDYFPNAGYRDGWIIDALLRDYIGIVGVNKILKNVRDDDMIILNDADELPIHETLLFLKVNMGYPQPIGFKLRHNVFGFFWQGNGEEDTSEVYGAVSISILRSLYSDSVYAVRAAPKHVPRGNALEHYIRQYHVRFHPWSFGLERLPAGWHCSWCFTPEGIRIKLHSAHVSDEPRYGHMEGKDSLPYIQHLIKTGSWFDNKKKFDEVIYDGSKLYAPSFIIKNRRRFIYLMSLPL